MSWLYKFLDGGILTNLVFLILAVVSVLISILLYLKSKREKELVFIARSFELIENATSSIDNLTIKYGNENVEALTLTKLSLWNNGKATIDAQDIVDSDKLRVELPESIKIYSAVIEMTAKKYNCIQLYIEDNKIIINFDFLDYGDGVIINFYHNGTSEQKIILTGTLKGALPVKPAVEVENLPITNYFGQLLFRKYWDDERQSPSILEKVIACVLLPFAILLLLIFLPFDVANYVLFKKIPKQFILVDRGTDVGR